MYVLYININTTHLVTRQGWGAGRSRLFLASWSRSRLKKKNQESEPEPFQKNSKFLWLNIILLIIDLYFLQFYISS